jgi:3-oxoadipate enol-lactonase
VPIIRANGLDHAVLEAGEGPPLILLHGAGATGEDQFAGLLPFLVERFRVIAPDARGHGATTGFTLDADDGRLDTADLATDVLALADAMDLATFHLLGFSMGGMTALHVAARVPARLLTLVLISIATEREPRLAVARRLLDVDRVLRDDPIWARQLAHRHRPQGGPDAWRRLLPAVVADIAAQPLLGPADLRAIDAPTLVIAGDRDPLGPVPQAHALSRQVRDGRLLVVPDTGHDVLGTRPAIVRPAIAQFHSATMAVATARAGVPLPTEVRP